MRNWPEGLAVVTVIVLIGLTGIALISYREISVYFTGEPVTARISDCRLRNPDRPTFGFVCAGTWTQGDGRRGSAPLEGVSDDRPTGSVIATRVRGNVAVIDSARWTVYLCLGCVAAALLATIAVRTGRRWYRER